MAEENKRHEYERETKVGKESGAVETKDRGFFDLIGKKEEEKTQVSGSETKVEEDPKEPTVSEKLHGFDSRSGSIEEEKVWIKEEKMKAKISGEKGEEKILKKHEGTIVPFGVVHTEKLPGHKKTEKFPSPPAQSASTEAAVCHEGEDKEKKKRILKKLKENSSMILKFVGCFVMSMVDD